MAYLYPIHAVIFDMDGVLIDSEPLWLQAELDIFSSLGLDPSIRCHFPNTVGSRIDTVVEMWYQFSPWQGVSQKEVSSRIVERTIELLYEKQPLLPGVQYALELCKGMNLTIGLASASPLFMLQQVLEMFNLQTFFKQVVSAEHFPYSKPHPAVYLCAAERLRCDPLSCITIEDSVNGMIATKAARMQSIVIPAREHFTDPHWVLAEHKLCSLEHLTIHHLGLVK